MVKAAKVVIAEVDTIVPVGSFGFDEAHVNGIYVDYLYQGNNYLKTVERLVYDQSVYDKHKGIKLIILYRYQTIRQIECNKKQNCKESSIRI